MRMGMMQPYFFPYLGYFGLIDATDHWIVFDTPQYIRRGWVNRNRVLSTGSAGWKYARIPVASCGSFTPIREIRIATRQEWQRELFDSLDAYRLRKAPHYQQTISFLQNTLSLRTENLSELLVHCLNCCCQRLDLPFHHRSFSQMKLDLPAISHAGDWALRTSEALNADEYINPPGGRNIFKSAEFEQANIRLTFLQPNLPAYEQGCDTFQPNLSIIDAFMWNSADRVREMISKYDLVAA